VCEQWLHALDGVCGVVWWSKSNFGGNDRSVSAAFPCLSGEHDIIVSSLASVVFFFFFPFSLQACLNTTGLMNSMLEKIVK